MSENFGVDFIARCMAGEALEQAQSKAWTIVAGNSISVLSDEEEKTDTIGLDGTLPTDVNANVSNSQLTIQLEDENGTTIGSGATVNLPSGLPPSTSSDEGKVLTVNSSGNAEWDETQYNIFRTAYVDMLNNCLLTVDGNNYTYEFDAPANFEKVDVYIRCHYIWRNTTWTGDNKVSLAHQLSITPNLTTATDGRTVVWRHGFDKANMPGVNWQGDFLDQAITLTYDSANGKLKMKVGAPAMWRCEGDWSGATTANSPVSVSGFVLDALGYVKYGSDDYVVYDGLTAGSGIDITNDVISLDANYGASFELSINSSTYVLTATLKDQNGNTLGTPQTVDLPLETMVVSGSYDDTTKKIVLTLQNGQTVEFSVADLVDGLETSAHAASTYQTIAGMSNYATQNDISDMATQTWVGNQGFLTTQEQADWTESDNTDPAYIKNKPSLAAVATSGSYTDLSNTPTIPAAQVNSDWSASSGVAQILNKPNLATVATSGSYTDLSNTPDLSDMATQTWVGQQGYLTSADEVPIVGSTDDGKILTASYSGGSGSYSWQNAPSGLPTSTSSDEGKALTVDSNGDPVWGSVNWYGLANVIAPPTMDQNVHDGDVLTYDAANDMAYFTTPSSGGLSVETDGTNYWITVNGIRLYFASSEPSGTIPDGSMGIGW